MKKLLVIYVGLLISSVVTHTFVLDFGNPAFYDSIRNYDNLEIAVYLFFDNIITATAVVIFLSYTKDVKWLN